MAIFKNVTLSSTGTFDLPSGTTTQRPIIIQSTPGTYTWTVPEGVTNLWVLVVGGGGGGGGDVGGGGGGGQVVENKTVAVTPGQVVTYTVGAGGAAGSSTINNRYGLVGGNSTLSVGATSITAVGGSGGQGRTGSGPYAGGTGYNGGGGSYDYSSSTSYSGGFAGGISIGGSTTSNGNGGGGGSGGPGFDGKPNQGGDGGPGYISEITGSAIGYGGGGAGSYYSSTNAWTSGRGQDGGGDGGNQVPTNGTNGIDGFGGGGGGGPSSGSIGNAGRGGNGTVIINYAQTGQIRFNTDINMPEGFDGTYWQYLGGPVTDGLISWIDASNPASYSGSGTTIYDLSGNGNNWIIQGSVSWSPTYGWGNFEANSAGNGNKIYAATPSAFYNLKTSQGGSGYTIIAIAECEQDTGSGWKKIIANEDGENYIELYKQSGGAQGWHQDGDQSNLYVNGYAVSNDTYSMPGAGYNLWMSANANGGTVSNPDSALTIGNEPNTTAGGNAGTNAYPWHGHIAEVMIWNRVLSDAELKQMYAYACQRNQWIGDGTAPSRAARSGGQLRTGISGARSNGQYWMKPATAVTPTLSYVDFTTEKKGDSNAAWVHVGTALGATRGLWTYHRTWAYRDTNAGTHYQPYHSSASNFNATTFVHCKGYDIMIKEGVGNLDYVTCLNAFQYESWRDVYAFLRYQTGWDTQPGYNRQLTISTRSGSCNVFGNLIYGVSYATNGSYPSWFVYGRDASGDTMGWLSTSTYGGTNLSNEADHGIGVQEQGPGAQAWPGDTYATEASTAFDAGTNDATDQGNTQATAGWWNNPYSIWIRN